MAGPAGENFHLAAGHYAFTSAQGGKCGQSVGQESEEMANFCHQCGTL